MRRCWRSCPASGTVVGQREDSSAAEPSKLLDNEVERLAVEAIKLGLSLGDGSAALEGRNERSPSDFSKRRSSLLGGSSSFSPLSWPGWRSSIRRLRRAPW